MMGSYMHSQLTANSDRRRRSRLAGTAAPRRRQVEYTVHRSSSLSGRWFQGRGGWVDGDADLAAHMPLLCIRMRRRHLLQRPHPARGLHTKARALMPWGGCMPRSCAWRARMPTRLPSRTLPPPPCRCPHLSRCTLSLPCAMSSPSCRRSSPRACCITLPGRAGRQARRGRQEAQQSWPASLKRKAALRVACMHS